MKVSAQYAAEHFDDLVIAAGNGQVVEIELPDKTGLQLMRSTTSEPPKPAGNRILGAGKALLRVPNEEEWDIMHKEWLDSFSDKFGD